MNEIVNLRTDALKPNSYNPNQMTDDEFAECLAEVRHLGRLPKPVIVRPNGAGYTIVDGEHGWRCAVEAKLDTVACEVVEVDDFEAMRQTYKRNQHGTHNPVKLGNMFQQMMADRNLSQRALAEDIEVSEGTVRNALEYAKAKAVRNDYAVESLSTKQVRLLNRMPEGAIDYWLKCKAPVEALAYEKKRDQRRAELHGERHVFHSGATAEDAAHANADKLAELVVLGLFKYGHHGLYPHNEDSFRKAIQRARKWYWWLKHWCHRGISMEQIIPYAKHYFRGVWYVRENDMMGGVFNKLILPTDSGVEFTLTAEEFDAVIAEQQKVGGSNADFEARLNLAIYEKTGTQPDKNKHDVKMGLIAAELADAPDYIRESKISDDHKMLLWKFEPQEWDNSNLFEAAKEKMANEERRIDEEGWDSSWDAVWQTFLRYKNAAEKRHLYFENSTEQLAGMIALRMPFYSVEKESKGNGKISLGGEHHEEVARLAENLSKLTKQELMYFGEVTEFKIWTDTLANLARSIKR